MSTRAWSRCLEALKRAIVSAVLFTVHATGLAANSGREAPVDGAPTEPIVVGLTVNATSVADAQLVHRATGRGDSTVWLPVAQALAWRLDLARRPVRTFEGEPHAAFCAPPDRCDYDDSAALLSITLPTAALLPLRIGPDEIEAEAPIGGQSGGYLNYDLATWKNGAAGVSVHADGHVYTPYGHGALRLGVAYSERHGVRTPSQAVWQVDQPERGRSMQFGSIVIPDTSLSAGLPVTGVRIGSNRQLEPLRPLTMRPYVDGVTERAVRTDVYVDGVFRQAAQVPYGPYRIEMTPQFPGRGDIEIVSTDPSGLQVRRTLAYYQSSALLAPGASEWSLDAGLTAEDGKRRVDGAGRPPVASAWWRRGLDPSLTAQGQLLAAPGTTRLAVGADAVAARLGGFAAGAVWQRSPSRSGGKLWLQAGHEYVSRDIAFSARTEQIVGGCGAVATASDVADRLSRPCQRTSVSFGAGIGPRWSVSFAADLQRERNSGRSGVVSVNARLQMGPVSQIGLSLQRIQSGDRSAQVALLSYSLPLGDHYGMQTGVQRRSDTGHAVQWAVQKLPSVDDESRDTRFQAYGSASESRGSSDAGARWSGEADRFGWQTQVGVDRRGATGSTGINGAIGLAEGRVFTSRRIDDAFVLVDVGLPGLPVLLDNREVARTNDAGWAIVTGARARQANNVGVDTSALPIQYAMPLDQLNVVPDLAGGVLARFDLSDGGIPIPVRDADGTKLPTGARARISSQSLPSAVTSRGEVFLDRSDRPATIVIEFGNRRCEIRYEPGAAPADGTYRCPAAR